MATRFIEIVGAVELSLNIDSTGTASESIVFISARGMQSI